MANDRKRDLEVFISSAGVGETIYPGSRDQRFYPRVSGPFGALIVIRPPKCA